MRRIDRDSIQGFPTFDDWFEACDGLPTFFTYRRWRETEIQAVLIPLDEEIHLKKAWQPYSYKDGKRKRGASPKTGEHVLTLTPDAIEIVTAKKPVYGITSIADNVLSAYGLETNWVPCGSRRGNTSIIFPHKDIDPDPVQSTPSDRNSGRWRRNYTLNYLIKQLHSVDWVCGLKIDYKGRPINAELPSVTSCKKAAESYHRRSNAMSDVHDFAYWLGFGSSFHTDGYPLPKEKTRLMAETLNLEAAKLGYENVADAWRNNVPILGELDEEFHEFHAAGLTNLLADSVKESRKKR